MAVLIENNFFLQLNETYTTILEAASNFETDSAEEDVRLSYRYIFDSLWTMYQVVEGTDGILSTTKHVWENLMHHERTSTEIADSFRFYRNKSMRIPYLTVDRYHKGYTGISWNTNLSLNSLIPAVNRAFADNHKMKTIELCVDVKDEESSEYQFEADMPLRPNEIQASVEGNSIVQVRFLSREFDLYISKQQIGIVVVDPNIDHIMDFYRSTSSRALDPYWVSFALEHAGIERVTAHLPMSIGGCHSKGVPTSRTGKVSSY